MWCQVSIGNIGGTLCKVHDCLTTMLYTWNWYKIILNVNSNWKIKFKKTLKIKTIFCPNIRPPHPLGLPIWNGSPTPCPGFLIRSPAYLCGLSLSHSHLGHSPPAMLAVFLFPRHPGLFWSLWDFCASSSLHLEDFVLRSFHDSLLLAIQISPEISPPQKWPPNLK